MSPSTCLRRSSISPSRNHAGAVGGYRIAGQPVEANRTGWTLIATPSGLPIAFAMSNPKDDERVIAGDMLEIDPALLAHRPGQTVIADKGFRSDEFEAMLTANGATLIRPSVGKEPARPGQRFLKPFRQIIESINQTLQAHLDLERHAARTFAGITARLLQRLLALTAAIWQNELAGQPVLRSLTAYDH